MKNIFISGLVCLTLLSISTRLIGAEQEDANANTTAVSLVQKLPKRQNRSRSENTKPLRLQSNQKQEVRPLIPNVLYRYSSCEERPFLDERRMRNYVLKGPRETDLCKEICIGQETSVCGFDERGFCHKISYYRTGKFLCGKLSDHQCHHTTIATRESRFSKEPQVVVCTSNVSLDVESFFIIEIGNLLGSYLIYFPSKEDLSATIENEYQRNLINAERKTIEDCLVKPQQAAVRQNTGHVTLVVSEVQDKAGEISSKDFIQKKDVSVEQKKQSTAKIISNRGILGIGGGLFFVIAALSLYNSERLLTMITQSYNNIFTVK